MSPLTARQVLALVALILFILSFVVSGFPFIPVAGILLSLAVLL